MNIRWVVLFAAVAEERSFTRAATRLNMAQPWVSAQIRKLEYELGVQLLTRTKTGAELTAEGQKLFSCAQQIAEASRQFRDLARAMGDVQNKIVRLGTYLPILDNNLLASCNEAFAERYPQFSVRAGTGDMASLLADLRAGQLDLVVGMTPVDDPDQAFETISLGPVLPYLLLPRRSPLHSAANLAGQTLAAPAAASHPRFYDALYAPLLAKGAAIRSVPEADRRAMEHHVRTHGVPVIMIEGDALDYDHNEEFRTLPLDGFASDHAVLRLARAEHSRAATRYWALAAQLSSEDELMASKP